ncbi:MAG: thiamine diphosphokinase [Candidatus Marinimicrobia bacterium]|nr:thiamine diphosphokinase [Candidatus Neomarinimicrobiota bacterium]
MNILIVLAGNPPSKSLLKTEIILADLVLAVDGGLNAFRMYKLQPDIVLGDMDSTDLRMIDDVEIVSFPDQNLTDLQKTLSYVFDLYSIKSITLLGAGGARSDHFLNNLHICASMDDSVKVLFKNEISDIEEFEFEIIQRITPQCIFDLPVKKGSTLSILPIADFSGLKSEGLKWEIQGLDYSASFISQSNQAVKDNPTLSIQLGYAYIAVYQ